MNRICSRCLIDKEINEFGKRKDGRHGVCKVCRNNITKKWRKSESYLNKVYTDDEISSEKDRKRKYYLDNKEDILKRSKEYRENNKDYTKEYKKMYYYKNRDKLIDYSSEYHLDRMKNDSLYKFRCNVRNLIRNSIKFKGYKKNTKTEKILGIAIFDFLKYIESKFEPWMSWDNYGDFDGNIGREFDHSWSIDHIIPINIAKNEEEVILLNHYSNLQPLCSRINMHVKNGRLDYKSPSKRDF